MLILGGPTGLQHVSGKPAGWLENTGYYRTRFQGRNTLNHRIIYESLLGPIPSGMQIDHINGIRTDNRIDNLRLVTQQDNLANMKGIGVSRVKDRWTVERMFRGVRYRKSGFLTMEDAVEFSQLLSRELKGEFHRE